MSIAKYCLILALLLTPLLAQSTALISPPAEFESSSSARDVIYCQDPDYSMIYQMSSGFNAEIADDIPVEFTGEIISTVTLWLGEWYYGGGPYWTEPDGIRLNFYHEACPPELLPYHSVEVPWVDLDKDLIFDNTSSTVYELRIHLDPPLEVGEFMSIGATALISWGTQEPFTGIVATPWEVSYGACPAWLDAANWGYIRWTSIDNFTTIPQDMAYCLSTLPTDVAEPASRLELSAYPNPFNPRTQLRAKVEVAGHVSLRIHDIAGRHVATLFEGQGQSGEFTVDWNGRDQAGHVLAAGLYFAILESGGRQSQERLVLLK